MASEAARDAVTPEGVPLVALLGRGEAAFVAEFDRRVRETTFCALSLAHSRNVLRHLSAGPMRASQIVAVGDVSKQAISQQLAHLEANGYVAIEPDPCDQRARIVSLTAKGRDAQVLVRELFGQIERDWEALIGEGEAASLRRILGILLDRVPPSRPVC